MALPDTYLDCKTYADKLQHRLRWAYQAAQKCINKETTRYKKYYDQNYKCAVLKEGDLVLVRIMSEVRSIKSLTSGNKPLGRLQEPGKGHLLLKSGTLKLVKFVSCTGILCTLLGW